MKVILTFDDAKFCNEAKELLTKWLRDSVEEKSRGNHSPLRYADTIEFVEDGKQK